MSKVASRLFRVCPKTGKIVGLRASPGWLAGLYPLIGLPALIWFLVRVVPKPSRAAYPCQRVAAPLASSFVLWLLGISGAALAFRRARQRLYQARYAAGGLFLLLAALGIGWSLLSVQEPAAAAYAPHTPNSPMGTARGLMPGRVMWVHDPTVTDWSGPSTSPDNEIVWDDHVDEATAARMLSRALQGYAGQPTDAAAWDAIIRYFNGGEPYQSGQKVFIKINQTTSNSGGKRNCANADWTQKLPCGSVTGDNTANAPWLVKALVNQLVNVVGVAQQDITIGDTSGIYVDYQYDPVHDTFPDVVFMDNLGYDAGGPRERVQAAYSDVPLCWSTNEDANAREDRLPTAFTEATYFINFAILKSHNQGGITVNAKNHYGSMFRTPTGVLPSGVSLPSTDLCPAESPPGGAPPLGTNDFYHVHNKIPGATGPSGAGYYRPLVDLMGHEQIGGKTLLYLIDGIYGGKSWDSMPSTWALTPFNGDWPSSLFLSMDAVAIESVGFDFVSQQWPEHAIDVGEGVQDHMHEAALADNPPSGTFYDPEGDGTRMASLGVHEHWNNPADKQYTRNLDPVNGTGIELVYEPTPWACGIQTILFVGNSNPLGTADQALADHLADQGYRVVAMGQSQVQTAHATGKELVIISDSVNSDNITTKFRDVPVPVIVWEPALFDDMKMTGSSYGTDAGSVVDQTQIQVVDGSHPLAGGRNGLPGLSGLVTTTSTALEYFWGVPSAGASVVATLATEGGKATNFGYETGAAMVGLNAPARRVGFFNGQGPEFTAEGWALFDAAVMWAARCGSTASYTLVNADTGEEIGPLNNGDMLNLTKLPTRNLTIRAEVDPSRVGSVVFGLDGNPTYRTDNEYPYCLEDPGSTAEAGAEAPLAPAWTPGVGPHTLTAVPFSGPDQSGLGGASQTIVFHVTDQPTGIALAGLSAVVQMDGVLVQWQTASEFNNVGFRLYRAGSADGPPAPLHEGLIPSQVPPGSPAGANYQYLDVAVQPESTYYYWLEDVENTGLGTFHGPVVVEIGAGDLMFEIPPAETLTEEGG